MTVKLLANRVRRTYLGGGRIDAFTGGSRSVATMGNGDPGMGNGDDGGVPRPEDWLASTTQAFNGACEIEGEGLGRLEDGRLVKDAVGGLPILVKLLDSDERLVIQAHPTVSCAKRLFNSPVGKTECWHFLPGTAPDACVYLGFKPGVTRETWERAVWKNVELWNYENGNGTNGNCHNCSQIANTNPNSQLTTHNSQLLLEMLHRVPVAPGDFVFVDGGVPHAIGAGCFMVELQEPSDLMVVAERFTPSGRRIPDAKMHGGVGWGKMFDVYEYEGLDYKEACRRYVRRGCASASLREAYCICGPEFTDKFSMWHVAGGGRIDLPYDCAVAVVTDGAGSVNGIDVKKGDRLLVYGEKSADVQGGASLLLCA